MSASSDNGQNYFTERGAKMLGKRIEGYWRNRGYVGIQTHLIEHVVDDGMCEPGERKTIYFVRSNIGPLGYPPKEKAA
jgi:hypothetical protein